MPRHDYFGRERRYRAPHREHQYFDEYDYGGYDDVMSESDYGAMEEAGTPLELYVRRRFSEMADRVRDEREQITALLSRYEDTLNKNRELDPVSSSTGRRGGERRRDEREGKYKSSYSTNETPYGNQLPQKREFDDLDSVEEKATEPTSPKETRQQTRDWTRVEPQGSTTEPTPVNLAQCRPRPRYLAPTASSRRRWLEQEIENRINLEKDPRAHEEVYPVPLHIAARLGIPGQHRVITC